MATHPLHPSPHVTLHAQDLIKGETDGSSFPNGGLRNTHTAGGYLAIDPSSPIFLRGDTIFLPSCFVSYYGHALDEKTPVHRSSTLHKCAHAHMHMHTHPPTHQPTHTHAGPCRR